MTESSRNDEIDLLDLFRRIGRGISRFFINLWKALVYTIIFLLKNWLPLLSSVIAGIALSYLLKYTLGPTFRSEIILRTNVATSNEMAEYINRLYYWSREKNLNALSAALATGAEDASKIKEIRAFYLIDQNNDGIPDFTDFNGIYNPQDTTLKLVTDRIAVQVKTSDNNLFPVVKNGLLAYINSDSLLQRRNRVRLQQYKELFGRIDYDISQLDSLQKVKYFEETRNRMPASGGQIVFLQEQKTQLLYDDIYNLYSRKQNLENQQIIYNDIVTVIKDFTVPEKPVTRMLYYGIYIIPGFFIITIILLLLKRFSNSVKDYYNKV